ncbi:MAG: ABC transporter permease [Puniceicoccaceae bacterium]|nr:MAG: ABC transporter permease [Puniceicoccaceae bacterium]
MLKFVVYRLFQTIPVLFVIVTMTFFMVRAAPGGPFSEERQVSPQILERMNEHYGLNDPLLVQYWNYLKNITPKRFRPDRFHGEDPLGDAFGIDLGPSFKHEGRTVNEMIAESFPVSLELGLLALAIALCFGVPTGILAAVRRNSSLDYVPMSTAMVGICLPSFVIGPIFALVFGLWLGWFNVSGWFQPSDRILPAFTLGLFYAAYMARLSRGGMLEILSQDYIRTARAKGLRERTVIFIHALKGGLLPVVSFLGPALAGLISGSFVVETIFQIPGLGRHFINGALNRDYSMVLGTVLFYATLIIIMNLLVDIIQVMLNPKLKYE